MKTSNDMPGRLAANSAETLAKYVEQNRDKLLEFIRNRLGRRLRGKVEPEDIYQELCTEALVRLSKIEAANSDSLLPLFQMAERCVIRAHRHFFEGKKRDATREIQLDSWPNPASRVNPFEPVARGTTSPLENVERRERKAKLNSALGKLSRSQRRILWLRYEMDLPSKQIATQLGKSDGAVRIMLSRTIKQLADILSADSTES